MTYSLNWNKKPNLQPGDMTGVIADLDDLYAHVLSQLAQPVELHQTLEPLDSAWQRQWNRLGRDGDIAQNANLLWVNSDDDSFRANPINTGEGIERALTEVFPGKTAYVDVDDSGNAGAFVARSTWGTTDIQTLTFDVEDRDAYLVMRWNFVFYHSSVWAGTRWGWCYSMDGACPGLMSSGHVGTLATESQNGGILWFNKHGTPATYQMNGRDLIWVHPTLLSPGSHTVQHGVTGSTSGATTLWWPYAYALKPPGASDLSVILLEPKWELIYT